MIRTDKLWLHLASTVALIGAACWWTSDRAWEPGMTVLAALVTYISTLTILLKDQFKYGESKSLSSLTSMEMGSSLEQRIPKVILDLAESRKADSDDTERVLFGFLGLLFKKLKILAVDKHGRLQPASDRAKYFLRIMAYVSERDLEFGGNWRAEGSQHAEAVQLGDVLEKIDNHRVQRSGGVNVAKPIRSISSSLVLIKALKDGEAVFLLRWSDAWGGYYWFVGGIQEDDESPEDCAKREMREEICIADSSVQSIAPFATVKDRRTSSRQRVLTEYSYTLYSASLDESDPSCASILKSEPVVSKIVGGGHCISQQCRWHTWAEIQACPRLSADAGAILNAISKFGVSKIPLSIAANIN